MPAVATSVTILGLNLADWVAVLSIIVIVSGFLRLVWTRAIRPLTRLLDDIQGEPARLGVKAQPGWAERLTNIEDAVESVKAEVTHNGGGSMKDQTHRIEQAVEEVNLRSVDLTRKLNDHIADTVRRDERIHHLEVDVHRLPCDECGHLHHGDPQT